MPLPRLRSGLLELLGPPLRPELLDDEPLLPLLLEEAPLMPLFELLMSSLLVLPVLPTLERSLLRVLPTLLDAPNPLSLLLLELLLESLPDFDELLFNPLRFELLEDEPLVLWSELLFELSDMMNSSDCDDSPASARSIHTGKATALDRTQSATSRVRLCYPRSRSPRAS